MSSVNKVILLGNLGADPDIRRTQDGRLVVSFRMATGDSWRDKATGERKQRSDWHSVVIFNEALAKVAEQYLKKGSKVFVEGQQKTRKWTDKNGGDRWITETVLGPFNSKLVLLDRAERAPAAGEGDYGEGDQRDSAPPADGAPPNDGGDFGAAPATGGKPDMNDEIPF